MKKRTINALIFAFASIIVGSAMILCAFWAVDFDPDRISTIDYEVETVTVSQEFENIEIYGRDADVRFTRSEDGSCTVTYAYNDDFGCSVKVVNGTLIVSHSREKEHEIVVVQFGSVPPITVCLPAAQYGSAAISVSSGEVSVPQGFSFDSAFIESSSGDIVFSADARKLTASASSGCITVDGSIDAANITASSGDIRIDGSVHTIGAVTSSGYIDFSAHTHSAVMSSSSGDVRISGVSADTLTAGTTSGYITLRDTTAASAMELSSTSGDIRLDYCDAGSIGIETTSGYVRASLRSSKLFDAHTTSGDIRLPESDSSAGYCRIRTVSGDIDVNVIG